MSGGYTRMNLDEGHESSETDWDRLRALSEAEIDAAIASDTDAYSIETTDCYVYNIVTDDRGQWRWTLRGRGRLIAVAGRGYDSREAAQEALDGVRRAFPGARAAA